MGYGLWVNLIQRAEPHREALCLVHDVALQVAFGKANLKNRFFHLIGYRLWVLKSIGYGSWVNLIPTCNAPPRTAAGPAGRARPTRSARRSGTL
jgi:hypothetical protein